MSDTNPEWEKLAKELEKAIQEFNAAISKTKNRRLIKAHYNYVTALLNALADIQKGLKKIADVPSFL